MKLLYLNHNVVGTGTYQRAFHLAREMSRLGHRVTLVTTSRRSRLRFGRWTGDGVEVVEAPDLWWGPARTGWDPWNTLRRIGLLRGEDWELVHAFDSRPAVILPALATRRRTGAALVLDWADWWGRGGTIRQRSGFLVRTFFGPVETWFEEAFRTDADATTVISGALERRALGLGVPGHRILRFPNGCAVSGGRRGEADPGAVRRSARRRLGIDPQAPLIVHLGVLQWRDMVLLAESHRHLVKRWPAAKLALVGHPGAQPPRDLLVRGRLMGTGYVDRAELERWLAAADLCVLPLADTLANQARWPGRVNEYLAAGRATVMTRVGDAAAYVERHGAGRTCAAEPGALAEAMGALLSDAAALESAGRAARRLAESELAWGGIADRVAALYQGILDRARDGVGVERRESLHHRGTEDTEGHRGRICVDQSSIPAPDRY